MRNIINYLCFISGILILTVKTSDYGAMQRYPWQMNNEQVRNRPSNLLTLQDFLRKYATMQRSGTNAESMRTTGKRSKVIGKDIELSEGRRATGHHAAITRKEMEESEIQRERAKQGLEANIYRTTEEESTDRSGVKGTAEIIHHLNSQHTRNRDSTKNEHISGSVDELSTQNIETDAWKDENRPSAYYQNSEMPFVDRSNRYSDEKADTSIIQYDERINNLKDILSSLEEMTSGYDSDVHQTSEDNNTTLRSNILKGIEMGLGYLKSVFKGTLVETDRLIDYYIEKGPRNNLLKSDSNVHRHPNKRSGFRDREGYAYHYLPNDDYVEAGELDVREIEDLERAESRMDTGIDVYYDGEKERYTPKVTDSMELRTVPDNKEDEMKNDDLWNATSKRSKSSSEDDDDDISFDCLLRSSECVDKSSYDVEEVRKHKKKKTFLKKMLMPLLISYKLKFFALIPVLVSGLVLLVGSTGLAGFFLALFAAALSIRHHHES